jgi:hypothetical protein
MLVTVLVHLAAASICLISTDAVSPQTEGRRSERPLLYEDANHAPAAWVRDIRSQSFSEQERRFRLLSINHQIEYAAFQYVQQHPSTSYWMTLIARQRAIDDVIPALRASLSREPSDHFLVGLLRLLQVLSPLIPSQELVELENVSRARVARISNEISRMNAEDMLAEIPGIVRRYSGESK